MQVNGGPPALISGNLQLYSGEFRDTLTCASPPSPFPGIANLYLTGQVDEVENILDKSKLIVRRKNAAPKDVEVQRKLSTASVWNRQGQTSATSSLLTGDSVMENSGGPLRFTYYTDEVITSLIPRSFFAVLFDCRSVISDEIALAVMRRCGLWEECGVLTIQIVLLWSLCLVKHLCRAVFTG